MGRREDRGSDLRTDENLVEKGIEEAARLFLNLEKAERLFESQSTVYVHGRYTCLEYEETGCAMSNPPCVEFGRVPNALLRDRLSRSVCVRCVRFDQLGTTHVVLAEVPEEVP